MHRQQNRQQRPPITKDGLKWHVRAVDRSVLYTCCFMHRIPPLYNKPRAFQRFQVELLALGSSFASSCCSKGTVSLWHAGEQSHVCKLLFPRLAQLASTLHLHGHSLASTIVRVSRHDPCNHTHPHRTRTSRNDARAQHAAKQLSVAGLTDEQRQQMQTIVCDLESFKSVRGAARQVSELTKSLDAVVLNAGMVSHTSHTCIRACVLACLCLHCHACLSTCQSCCETTERGPCWAL